MSKLPIEMLEPPKEGQNFTEFEASMRRQIHETFFVPLEQQLDWRQRFALAFFRFRMAAVDRLFSLIQKP